MPIFLLLCFDYGTAYTCTNCGKYPSAYVMDGTTIAPLADKIKKVIGIGPKAGEWRQSDD